MREAILSEIRKIAAQNDGRAPGMKAFERETGIPQHKWYGIYWARWSDALDEAGYGPNQWQERLDSDQLLRQFADIITSLGRIPTSAELLVSRRSNPSIVHPKTVSKHFGGHDNLIEALRTLASTEPTYAHLLGMLPKPKATPRRLSSPTRGYVYLIKWGEHFKIGRSDDPGRALREIRAQLPTSANIIHTIETDDPVGIEAYWHNRFADRRLRGEWFELTIDDVKAFQRRKFQ